jgi:hypothetical protein
MNGATVLSVAGLCAALIGSFGYVIAASRVMLIGNLLVLSLSLIQKVRNRDAK